MNGLTGNGVTLFLGHIPSCKSLCFYFEEGSVIYPVAYIKGEYLTEEATKYWLKLIRRTRKKCLKIIKKQEGKS
jgi:hypothetical protein